MTVDAFIAAAISEVGYTENPPGSNRTKFAQEAGHTNGQPWCFVAGTLIDTPSGLVAIEELRVGNSVFSSTGIVSQVREINSRSAEVYELHAHGLDKTIASAEHPYLVKHRTGRDSYSESEWVPVSELQRGDMLAYPIPEEGTQAFKPELAYLLGRWVADGWRHRSPVGSRKTYLCDALEDAPGLRKAIERCGFKYCETARRTNCQFEISGPEFYELTEQFGHLAHGKHISPEVFGWDREARLAFLEGYLDGDGHYDPSGSGVWIATSVSRPLVHGIAKLLRSLGFAPRLKQVREAGTYQIEGRTGPTRPAWTVSFCPSPAKKQTFIADGYLWAPVRSVTALDYETEVFNLSVEGEHTFVADGAAVHNCATFIAAIANRTQTPLASYNPYTPTMEAGFKKVSMYGDEPRRGAIAFFDFPDKKERTQHVGIVLGWDGGYLTTVEGNTSSGPSGSQDNGGGVFKRIRPRQHVVGYGYPEFQVQPQTKEKQVWIIRLVEGSVVKDPTQYVTDFVTRRPIQDQWELDNLKAKGVMVTDYDYRLAARIPVVG